MTSGVLHSEPQAMPVADDPQFHHTIHPWALAATGVFLTVLLLAFFIYGQIAPGA